MSDALSPRANSADGAAEGPPDGGFAGAARGIDKRLVALRFGLHSADYDVVTPVQRGMGEALLEAAADRLAGRSPARILELGCGTGGLTRLIAERFPAATISAVELAAAMAARVRSEGLAARVDVADAEEHVRRDGGPYGLVISNAALQWFADPAGTVRRCLDLLEPGGVLALSTFADRTFVELRESFERAYAEEGLPGRAHVLPLPAVAAWREWLPEATLTEREVVCSFASVRGFLRSVREAGAALSVADRRPIPRRVFARMVRLYEERCGGDAGSQARIRVTYHTLCIVAAGPVAAVGAHPAGGQRDPDGSRASFVSDAVP
jgi:malonyl-CoA O-methyltransferase